MPKPYRFLATLVLILSPALSAFALSNLADGAAVTARVELGPILTLAEEATGHLAVGKGLGGDVLVTWATPYETIDSQIRGARPGRLLRRLDRRERDGQPTPRRAGDLRYPGDGA
jgi:hypothetical protein